MTDLDFVYDQLGLNQKKRLKHAQVRMLYVWIYL
jgi:hypothetical protein